MHADVLERECHIEAVIDHELDAVTPSGPLDLICEGEQLLPTQVSFTQLNGKASRFRRLCQDGHQWPAIGLMAIRHEQKPRLKRRHGRVMSDG
jgi:hypothetical protein